MAPQIRDLFTISGRNERTADEGEGEGDSRVPPERRRTPYNPRPQLYQKGLALVIIGMTVSNNLCVLLFTRSLLLLFLLRRRYEKTHTTGCG